MRWTEEMDRFMREHYATHAHEWLAKQLGVSKGSMQVRAHTKGIKGPGMGRRGSGLGEVRRDELETSVGSTLETIVSQPPQPEPTAPQATSEPTAHLAAPENSVADRNWTAEQDAILRRDYAMYGPTALAAVLDKTKMAIAGRAQRIGITHGQRSGPKNAHPIVALVNGKAPPPKLIPLTRTCVFIKGHRPYGDNPWCGLPVRPPMDDGKASPYCAEHHARCYQKHVLKGRKVPVRDVDGGVFR